MNSKCRKNVCLLCAPIFISSALDISEALYFYVNEIAVFINVFSEARRKTDMSYLVVTGVLKEK